ncbi:DUF3168 domain-containing protein [Methylibium sp.]|uniref:DUF3168 domain-containing protein n=1 Tax=Methylibium sp. TaxID=2067992 RepID=UPI001802D427|nr:DUF3168 domain-containing protein [Methylibium sp.]MBA3588301.1 DUF3168 domain-containing protein [Methylibium sp.]
MTLETDLYTALRGLVSDRVYPDVAPLSTPRPYITYQKVGGTTANFLESVVVPKTNARVQVNCWADTRLASAALMKQIEAAIVTSTTLRGFVLSRPICVHEDELSLYGEFQDFSIWS